MYQLHHPKILVLPIGECMKNFLKMIRLLDTLTFMEPDIKILFEEHAHAKTMFDAISDAYRASSETYIQLLMERFTGTEMKEDENVIDHVNKLSVIAKELATLDNPLPDRLQVSTILQTDCRGPKNNRKPNFGGSKDIVCVVSESILADTDVGAWWVDSASSCHVAKNKESFVEMKEVKAGDHRIYMGNNSYCDVVGIGTVKIMLPGNKNLYLTDVLYSPTMRRNLISVPRLDEKDFEVRFRSGKVSVGKHGRIMMWGSKVDGLYRLNIVSDVNNNALAGCSAYIVDSTHSYDSLYVDDPYIWHLRLGHINKDKMKRMMNMELIPKIDIDFSI
ncbi:hypothetical protein RHGRI_015682 [Rhododendron griersonianum]|uniref:GAG-pre-integrase domain-containing protein n=1 Tax=Rhododendron griersonianum TaxID=479676 RepID=A0AAV6KE96_9ERIC|nr:hypothetical protein RHGRI_015682 [Rhododendron griersonianum]